MSKGVLMVLSGPSGSGKGTVAKLLAETSEEIFLSVSATTRTPRPGEIPAKHYYFVAEEEFLQMIGGGKLLEYANYAGKYYGTPAEPVQQMLDQGKNVLLEIDLQGGLQVLAKRPDVVLVFLIPPSFQELERRLRGRGTESEEVVAQRLRIAEEEIEQAVRYHYIVTNGSVPEAAAKIKAIFEAERCRTGRLQLADFFQQNQDK